MHARSPVRAGSDAGGSTSPVSSATGHTRIDSPRLRCPASRRACERSPPGATTPARCWRQAACSVGEAPAEVSLGYGDPTPHGSRRSIRRRPSIDLSSGVSALICRVQPFVCVDGYGRCEVLGFQRLRRPWETGPPLIGTRPRMSWSLRPGSRRSPLGGQHACALVNGGAMCWGRNSEGQLGDGTTDVPADRWRRHRAHQRSGRDRGGYPTHMRGDGSGRSEVLGSERVRAARR